MKKAHRRSLTFHSLYSILLAICCIAILIIAPSISLAVAVGFLILYVSGNTFIHVKHGTLNRETVVEYVILSLIALVLVIGAFF